jgi:hypothetical protein
VKPIRYIEKRMSDNPLIRNELMRVIDARNQGQKYRPLAHRDIGLRTIGCTVTWEMLCTDTHEKDMERMRDPHRKPLDLTVSHFDGKQIGWNVRRDPIEEINAASDQVFIDRRGCSSLEQIAIECEKRGRRVEDILQDAIQAREIILNSGLPQCWIDSILNPQPELEVKTAKGTHCSH